MPVQSRKRFALMLDALAAAFLLRVVGQALVAFWHVDFLPTMERWYSGLMPYPMLLPAQILILAAQAKVSFDLRRGAGFFVVRRPRMGAALRYVSYLYAAGNLLRYLLTMAAHPESRWMTIPIFFHFVLAAYVYVLARYFSRKAE